MTRDYARYNVRKKPRKKSSYLGLWLFVLFLFVVFTVGLVYFGKYKQQLHLETTVPQKTVDKIAPAPEVVTKEVAPPKFDFYTILPQKINDKAITEYELEIATVKDYASADRSFHDDFRKIIKNLEQVLLPENPDKELLSKELGKLFFVVLPVI